MATLDMPTDQRSSYLDQACGSDGQLKARVKQLLRNVEFDGSFMAQPAGRLAQTAPHNPIAVGDWIGRYRLMEQIGEGGMGVVYVAEQVEPVRRKVALKIIKPGMDSKQVVGRFEAERQALALMDHPSIARVLDAGTTDQALPYFVMELVRGLPITQYCDQARTNTRERLKLFISICSAVQHAHQKGIIHRDIKPSNVLVTLHDGEPLVKVIDFGVAKALHQQLTNHTIYTALNQVIGTPLYMSPEQLELSGLDIDTRTDIYSLGVLLYELLTGETPFDRERLMRSGFDEMRRIIREEEAPLPSHRITTLPKSELSTAANRRGLDERTFSKSIRGELDWITLKALEKDRNRRFESASALGADIQRYLNDEPVSACPPSVVYRTKKLIRRHRAALTTAALVLLALIAGTVISVWQAFEAHQAKKQTLASVAIARQAVDDMYSEFAEKWLSEEGNASQVQREFLEKAVAYYDSTANQFEDDPTFDVERMQARERISAMQIKLGRHEEAETGLKELIEQCRQHLAAEPSRHEFAIGQMKAMLALGSMWTSLGSEKPGLEQLDQAAALLQTLAGRTGLERSQQAELATAGARLSTELQRANRREAAEAAAQTSLKVWQRLLSDDPNCWEYRVGLSQTLERQGLQRMWFGDRQTEARTALEESQRLLVELLRERPRDRTCRQTLAGVYLSLGVLSSWGGQHDRSLDFNQKGIAIADQLVADYPTDQKALGLVNTLQGNLHSDLKSLGEVDAARDVLTQRFESSEKLVDLFPTVPLYWRSYHDAAVMRVRSLWKEGNQQAASELAKRACNRIQAVQKSEEIRDESRLQEISNSMLFENAHLLISTDRYAQAAKTLDEVDFDNYVFQLEALERNTFVHTDLRYLNNCYEQLLFLQRPVALVRECLDGLARDPELTTEERKALSHKLAAAANRCEAEAGKVLDAWQARLDSAELSSSDIVGLYHLMTEESSDSQYRSGLRLRREVQGRVAKDLIRRLDQLGSSASRSDLSFIIGELVAGEEHVRDPELALQFARRGTQLDPKGGMAKQDLAWALFRNGQYQQSLDAIGGKPRTGDPTTGAIVAMVLWHLGRKDDAAEYLNAKYDKELAKYGEKRKKDALSGKVVWPTMANLLRLDREAKALVLQKQPTVPAGPEEAAAQ